MPGKSNKIHSSFLFLINSKGKNYTALYLGMTNAILLIQTYKVALEIYM